MSSFKASIGHFPSHCGTIIFHRFGYGDLLLAGIKECFNNYKTAIAVFVDDPDQRNHYEKLKREFKILYQSSILKNPSTNDEYIIVIYLNEKP